jgi:hypothetical protein
MTLDKPSNEEPPESAISSVLDRLGWMRREHIWPTGQRYLWTDAFGVVLLVSLYQALKQEEYLVQAEWLVAEVERVLGRPRGLRIGQAPERDGQYFHYLAMWIFALDRLGRVKEEYRQRAVSLVREIHPSFVLPGIGVFWKMQEDLSGPHPGFGFGSLDPFHGYVVYRTLAPEELATEIAEMRQLVEKNYPGLYIEQDLGLGMMLWFSHFFPAEPWAAVQRQRSLALLDSMWIDPPGYYCRYPGLPQVKFAFTNYGVALGLQAVGGHTGRVQRLHEFFYTYHSGDEYDRDAITHVMACTSDFPGEFILPGPEAAGTDRPA